MERISRRGFITSAGIGAVGTAALGGPAEKYTAARLLVGKVELGFEHFRA